MSDFSLTSNLAAGNYAPDLSPTPAKPASSDKPDWLRFIDDIVGAADKATSVYERFDYPSWKRAQDAIRLQELKTQEAQAQAQATQATAPAVNWIPLALVGVGVVALVLLLK